MARILLSKICAELINFLREIVNSPEFVNRHRKNPNDFTRTRKLPLLTLVSFMLSVVRGSYQAELDRFFAALSRSDIPRRVVTKAAWAKARMKLKYEAFSELNDALVQFFENNFKRKTWHGFRLLAVDGSTVRLPHAEDVIKHFGVWKVRQGKPSPMARLSQMFDPLNKITIDAAIGPKKPGERELASRHFRFLTPHDLVLLDRGYPAWWLFALILSKKAHFCARTFSNFAAVSSFLKSGDKERVVYLSMPYTSKDIARKLGLESRILKLRLLRIDNGGEPMALVTSLMDANKYPHGLFSDLYHCRWPVEEDYKAMKCRLELENFSGKSALSVYQDFHAKVLMKNIAAILAFPVNQMLETTGDADLKYAYQVNFTQALAAGKNLMPFLFQRSKRQIARIIAALFEILRKTREPIRPGRHYPRNLRFLHRRFFPCYKQLA